MEADKLNRLREEQELAISETNERISQLKHFKDDYNALRGRLKSLPDRITHDVMVPFGEIAFMPGQLIHTNEILVLLGDNWFVERSASQAVDLIDRRTQEINGQIEGLEQQKGLLEPRVKFTSKFTDLAERTDDLVEIKEEYDEEKEKLWREEHKKKVLAHREHQRREAKLKSEEQPSLTDEELWRKLDELELKEQQERELEEELVTQDGAYLTDSDGAESESSEDEFAKKKVRWKDFCDTNPNVGHNRKVINFSHTIVDTPEEVSRSSQSNIQSPSDIYKQFVEKKNPVSILKTPSTKTDVCDMMVEESSLQSRPNAFTGSIVERSTSISSESLSLPEDARLSESSQKPSVSSFQTVSSPNCTAETKHNTQNELGQIDAQTEKPRGRISKFKQQRQQSKR